MCTCTHNTTHREANHNEGGREERHEFVVVRKRVDVVVETVLVRPDVAMHVQEGIFAHDAVDCDRVIQRLLAGYSVIRVTRVIRAIRVIRFIRVIRVIRVDRITRLIRVIR